MPKDYLSVIVKTREWVKKNPGVTQTRLNLWMQSVFKIKSRSASNYINKMIQDDFLRIVVNVEGREPNKRGRPATRLIATNR